MAQCKRDGMAARSREGFRGCVGGNEVSALCQTCSRRVFTGVTRITAPEEAEQAFESAFKYDRKLIVEEGVIGRELEIAAIGGYENPFYRRSVRLFPIAFSTITILSTRRAQHPSLSFRRRWNRRFYMRSDKLPHAHTARSIATGFVGLTFSYG